MEGFFEARGFLRTMIRHLSDFCFFYSADKNKSNNIVWRDLIDWTFTAESEDAVFTFLDALAPDLIPLLDRGGSVTEAWKTRGLPSTYLVDPEGMIRYQVLGGRP